MYEDNKKLYTKRNKLKTHETILMSFLIFIFLGAILLSLPISSKTHEWTDFLTCLFTSTSAMCVTGLIVVDTATHWSLFGHIVILVLIQLGGMSIILVSSIFTIILGKRIGLFQRYTLQEALSFEKIGGVVKLAQFILKGFIFFELVGAILLLIEFAKDFTVPQSIWLSIFHSISAFCNAGFDLMGKNGDFTSLMQYQTNTLINVIIMLLIIIGGIGFMVWDNVISKKLNFRKYSLQSKIVILTTISLIIIPALYFFVFEYNDLILKPRILTSLFQSVTTRTAGFNTANFSEMTDVGKTISIILMLIGGSPGSTAGGMKTTTFAVLIISTIAVFRQENEAHIFNRRIEVQIVKNAITIFMLYITLFLISSFVIATIENFNLLDIMFEVASAIGTVGLTLGITPKLSTISRIILIIIMFLGRVGGLTFIYAIAPALNDKKGYISENITVG